MKEKAIHPEFHHVYQGTESERLTLRRRILSFAILCLVCVAGAFIAGFNSPENQFPYVVFAVGEAGLALALMVLASILASHKSHLRASVYRLTVAAIPGVCIALILCNALTVIAALVHLGRYGTAEGNLVFLLAALLLRLVCMESAHLCRRTVTHSVWSMGQIIE